MEGVVLYRRTRQLICGQLARIAKKKYYYADLESKFQHVTKKRAEKRWPTPCKPQMSVVAPNQKQGSAAIRNHLDFDCNILDRIGASPIHITQSPTKMANNPLFLPAFADLDRTKLCRLSVSIPST